MLNSRQIGILLLLGVWVTACGAEQDEYASIRDRLTICFGCHGEGGRSTAQQYPILAGQEFYYLYVQLKDYQSGLRASPVMGPIAETMEKTEMKALAKYFSEQQWPKIDYEAKATSRAAALAVISAGQCVACHLGGFEGNSRIPRLAGQHRLYLEKTMLDFKTKARANSPSKSSLMASFTDEEIAIVADHLGGL